jgi:hypothetical protein
MAVHQTAIIATAAAARHTREMLWCVTRNFGIPVVNVPSSAIVPRPRMASVDELFIDVLLCLESSDQCLDTLFLRIRRSGSLRLLGITGRAGEITRCGLDAGLS